MDRQIQSLRGCTFEAFKERKSTSPQAIRNLFVQLKDIITELCNTQETPQTEIELAEATKLLQNIATTLCDRMENSFYFFFVNYQTVSSASDSDVDIESVHLQQEAIDDFGIYYEIFKNASIMLAELAGQSLPEDDRDLVPINKMIHLAATSHYHHVLQSIRFNMSRENPFQTSSSSLSSSLTPQIFLLLVDQLSKQLPHMRDVCSLLSLFLSLFLFQTLIFVSTHIAVFQVSLPSL